MKSDMHLLDLKFKLVKIEIFSLFQHCYKSNFQIIFVHI